jgi:hypothetical protein
VEAVVIDNPVAGSSDQAVGGNPFPGLHNFEPRDADLFFGRDAEVRQLIERLRERRLLAVVGVSGIGKSSVVRAGLIPRLSEGFMPGLPKEKTGPRRIEDGRHRVY